MEKNNRLLNDISLNPINNTEKNKNKNSGIKYIRYVFWVDLQLLNEPNTKF